MLPAEATQRYTPINSKTATYKDISIEPTVRLILFIYFMGIFDEHLIPAILLGFTFLAWKAVGFVYYYIDQAMCLFFLPELVQIVSQLYPPFRFADTRDFALVGFIVVSTRAVTMELVPEAVVQT